MFLCCRIWENELIKWLERGRFCGWRPARGIGRKVRTSTQRLVQLTVPSLVVLLHHLLYLVNHNFVFVTVLLVKKWGEWLILLWWGLAKGSRKAHPPRAWSLDWLTAPLILLKASHWGGSRPLCSLVSHAIWGFTIFCPGLRVRWTSAELY